MLPKIITVILGNQILMLKNSNNKKTLGALQKMCDTNKSTHIARKDTKHRIYGIFSPTLRPLWNYDPHSL